MFRYIKLFIINYLETFLYNRFSNCFGKDNYSYRQFLNKNKFIFLILEMSPWRLFFLSRLNQEVSGEQFLSLSSVFYDFIEENKLDYSLNDSEKTKNGYRSFFEIIFHWGCFPSIDRDYNKEFYDKLIDLGLHPLPEDIQKVRTLLDGYRSYNPKNGYRWDLNEFNRMILS